MTLPRHARRALLAAAALIGGTLLPLTLQPAAHAAATPNGGDVIANLFEWNWPSVANECTTVLGPKGYGAVQVAPPEDSIRLAGAHPWWEVYQPVGYDLNSRMGTEAQFAAMVTACHAAGVKVYADTVINHAAGANQTSTDSYGGASFDPATYSYGSAGYDRSSFHDYPANCPNAGNAINDWNSVQQVQECQLVSLSDLYTEKDEVRAKLAGYLDRLVGYGVDGFRVDAAKHIAQADLANILSRVSNTAWGSRPYVYQEVFPGSGGQLAPSAFEGNGSVLEFTYAYKLKDQFNGSIAGLKSFGQSWGLEPSDKSAVMVTNHDLERNGSTLNYKSGSKYTLATLFQLAWGYGTPQVYAGFAFNGSDDSPPADANGYVTATDCSSGWVCTDRDHGVANMVGWHNAAKGQAVANWWDNGTNAIAFSRGSAAWVALNNGTTAVTSTFTTGLTAGTYCDIIHGDRTTAGTCTGPTVTVDPTGQATVTVNPGDAVALYATGAPPPSPSPSPSSSSSPSPSPSSSPSSSPSTSPSTGQVNETFHETRTTTSGQSVYLTGSLPALGGWDTGKAIPLSSAGYPVWSGTVSLPAGTAFEYKYVLKDSAGNVTWEPGGNHTATTGSTDATLTDTWAQTVAATFNETRTTAWGQNVYLTGSLPALGTWDTGKAIPLSSAGYPVWSGTVSLPAGTVFEYKYVLKDSAGNVTWESGANRTASTPSSGTLALNDSWK
ncbi:alpha-amylase [Kitasatospora sp. MMS16-BH015]|uniref:carbohydrate-binding module family 20 domain-containing protein n=1 Tax=Kitasatospora sp. MMS16-BH015 TaxID=2018025 RepID=UPI000CA1E5D5|nr:carbohydrate-binding module family 20 domain-containing protein [Kitasatospora sp. MMS16-BH015]AUG76232.1 alpha-amylase [Kitasatospora sp. MMS16-BH015]